MGITEDDTRLIFAGSVSMHFINWDGIKQCVICYLTFCLVIDPRKNATQYMKDIKWCVGFSWNIPNKPITSWMLPIQHSTLIQWWHTSLNCRTVCRNMNGMCRARKKIQSTYTTSALITQYNRWNAINDMAFWMSGTKWAMNQIESKTVQRKERRLVCGGM